MDRRTILALVAMCMGVFLVANDFTAPTVALPNIENDFDTGIDTVQWVLNGYSLVFGVLIVTAGRLADMFGRRRLFFIGAAVFALGSLAAALAPGIGVLLAARAVMAVGGATMFPAVLGMMFDALPPERQGIAGGLVIGVAGIGNAFGPILGGFLTEVASWRWVFLVNLPVAVLAIVLTARFIHQPFTRDPQARVDYAGVVALSIGLVALLVALDLTSTDGITDPLILGLFALCVVALVAFALVERRAGANALVPRSVMGNREFTWPCVAVVLLSVPFFASMLFLPQFFQKLLGYSALEAGVAFLPLMGSFALVSFASGWLYARVGAKLITTAGAVCQCIGIFLLSLMGPTADYLESVPGMIVLGIGVGLFLSTITTAAVSALDPSQSSLGGAILYMFQVAGGAIGLGLTTAVFTAASQDAIRNDVARLGTSLSDGDVHDVQGILAGTESAASVAARVPADVATITEVVQDAFSAGLRWGFRLNAALALAGVVVTVLFVGHWRTRPADAAPDILGASGTA